MAAIRITVTGTPVAKGRGRGRVLMKGGQPVVSQKTGQPVVTVFTPANTRKWEKDAKDQARGVMGNRVPLAVPVRVTVVSYFPVPTSWAPWKREAALQHRIVPTGRPDGDNVLKAAKDAICSIVYLDDSFVVASQVVKAYSARPRVEITVRTVSASAAQISRKGDLVAQREEV